MTILLTKKIRICEFVFREGLRLMSYFILNHECDGELPPGSFHETSLHIQVFRTYRTTKNPNWYDFIRTMIMESNKIREEYFTGMSIADISKKYGVKRYWIKKALVGLTRKMSDTNSMKARLSCRELSESEKQCVLGTLLGDGCLKPSSNGRSNYLSVTHGLKEEQYIRYKHEVLSGSHLRSEVNKNGYCPGSIQWNLTFWNARFLDFVHSVSQRDGKKTVTKEWLDLIQPEGLAYWFMDDGSSSYGSNPGRSIGVLISTMCFSKEENELLADKLNRYETDARVVRASRGTRWQISMSVSGGQKFLHLVRPYIERVPSMKYKLKFN